MTKTNKELQFKDSLSKKVKEQVKNWALSTTTHGIQKFTKAENCCKQVFWLIFIFTALGLCSYVVINNVFQYLEFDVTTKIRIIDQPEVSFPVISVCNVNPLITPFAENYIKSFFFQRFIYLSNTIKFLVSIIF